jgi:hypothetical protein
MKSRLAPAFSLENFAAPHFRENPKSLSTKRAGARLRSATIGSKAEIRANPN